MFRFCMFSSDKQINYFVWGCGYGPRQSHGSCDHVVVCQTMGSSNIVRTLTRKPPLIQKLVVINRFHESKNLKMVRTFDVRSDRCIKYRIYMRSVNLRQHAQKMSLCLFVFNTLYTLLIYFILYNIINLIWYDKQGWVNTVYSVYGIVSKFERTAQLRKGWYMEHIKNQSIRDRGHACRMGWDSLTWWMLSTTTRHLSMVI